MTAGVHHSPNAATDPAYLPAESPGRPAGDVASVPAGAFRTIVADPAWQYGKPKGTKAGAGYHYETLSLEAICALPVEQMSAEDSHLWIWGTNMKLDWAYQVARAWGFDPTTLLTWCKTQPGVGAYLRNNTEHCLLATRGKPQTPNDKPIASYFIWPRGEHSAKPDAFYDLVEQVSPGPYLELFARRARFGWDYWGDESLQTVELPAA